MGRLSGALKLDNKVVLQMVSHGSLSSGTEETLADQSAVYEASSADPHTQPYTDSNVVYMNYSQVPYEYYQPVTFQPQTIPPQPLPIDRGSDIEYFQSAAQQLKERIQSGISSFQSVYSSLESRDVEFTGIDSQVVSSIRLKMKDYEKMEKFKSIIEKLKSECEKKLKRKSGVV